MKAVTKHWALVKITSITLIPLTLWFFCSIICNVVAQGGTYDVSLNWIKNGCNAVALGVFLVINFYHAALGCEEIILDYIQDLKVRNLVMLACKVFCFVAAALGIYFIFRITRM
jgi:succinate dehydrogenase / fumarate reductase, membrane anchor subunit